MAVADRLAAEVELDTGGAQKAAAALSGALAGLGKAAGQIGTSFAKSFSSALNSMGKAQIGAGLMAGALAGAAVGAGELSDKMKSTAKTAGTAAKRTLASFDQIERLGSTTSSGGSGGSSGGSRSTTVKVSIDDQLTPVIDAIMNRVQALAAMLQGLSMAAMLQTMSGVNGAIKAIIAAFSGIGASIKQIMTQGAAMLRTVFMPLMKWDNSGIVTGLKELKSTLEDLMAQLEQEHIEDLISDAKSRAVSLLGTFVDAIPYLPYIYALLFGKGATQQPPLALPAPKEVLALPSGEEGDNAILGIASAFNQMGGAQGVSELFGGLTAGFSDLTGKLSESKSAFDLQGAAMTAYNVLSQVCTAVTTALGAAFQFLCSPIGLVILAITAVIAIIVLLVTHWDEVKEAAAKAWDWIVETWNGACAWFDETVIQPLAQFFSDLWEGFVQSVTDGWNWFMETVAAIPGWFYDHLIAPVGRFFTELWEGFTQSVTDGWNWFMETVAAIPGWFYDTFIAPVVGFYTDLWTGFQEKAQEVWDGIKSMFSSAAEFFSKVFDDAWQGVKDIFQGMWDFIVEVVNGIIGAINGMIQGVVGGINSVIGAINGISVSIPDWVPGFGGKRIGFNLPKLSYPQIPYLAQGAVLPANRPFLAMVGDQRHGTNVEAPLSTIQEAVALALADLDGRDSANQAAVLAVLREILEAVLGIRVGDEVIGRAAARYQRRMAVVNGGVL